MLIIRKDQLRAMELDVRVRNVTTTIRKALPEPCTALGTDAFRKRIELAFQKSEKYGMTEISEVIRFVQLMFVLGDDFDTAEAARNILQWTDVTNNFRLQALEKRANGQAGAGGS
ncbi:MAG TPA: hypothetical protein VGK48_25650 [Terriglobia bacterium]|jgi:hypothetical protein